MPRNLRLTCFLSVLAFMVASCGGSASTSSAPPSPSTVEDCRGATESISSGPSPSPGIQYIKMTVDRKLRSYRLFKPAGIDYTKQVPLVIVLHGADMDATRMEELIHFDDEATTAGFVAAYANGCSKFWAYATGGSKLADMHFIEKVLDRLQTDLRIDQHRVFIAGFSAGAIMSYRLACDLASRITAIVSVSGGMFADECKPTRPVSILEIHGTDDSAIPWQGGGSPPTSPVETVVQHWRTLNGCVGNPTLRQNGITKTSQWTNCTGGTSVRLDTVVGGHHTWFGSELNPVPGEPNANTLIWQFLGTLRQTG
jgi:polyhydroxybutyrate depolymerase